MLTLGVFIEQVFYFDGEEYTTDESLTEFTRGFTEYFDRVIFIARVKQGRGPYLFTQPQFTVVELPYYESLYSVGKKIVPIAIAVRRIFAKLVAKVDIFWLRGPNPIAIMLVMLCRRYSKAHFLVVGQDLGAEVASKYPNVRLNFALAVIGILEFIFRKLARRTLTFTVGRDLYEKYKKSGGEVIEIYSSLISRKSITDAISHHTREETTVSRPLRFITVGRLDPAKGLKFLLGGFSVAKERMPGCVLSIVGTGTEEPYLKDRVGELGLNNSVKFLGYIPFGTALQNLYRNADVLVVPSLSEGFPRVIIEAMSNGLPIIASSVGGIPHILTHGWDAILIEPQSEDDVAEALVRIQDKELRNRLISNGFKTVSRLTNEAQREVMYCAIGKNYPHLFRSTQAAASDLIFKG
jgi:glycosyltransferase involved in cell wall biosynthesis